MYSSSVDFNADFGERVYRVKHFISPCLQNSYISNFELVGLKDRQPPPPPQIRAVHGHVKLATVLTATYRRDKVGEQLHVHTP